MSKEETYEDEMYCGHCDKETRQDVHTQGHERDSSQDYQICKECGYIRYAGGEWRKPFEDPKPDMIDDVLDGGLKEMYNFGLDKAIEVIENESRKWSSSPIGANRMFFEQSYSAIINKLKALKK